MFPPNFPPKILQGLIDIIICQTAWTILRHLQELDWLSYCCEKSHAESSLLYDTLELISPITPFLR